MIYKRQKPRPCLRPFVEEYMFFSISRSTGFAGRVKVLPPLPEHGIEFLPRGLATIVARDTGIKTKESKVVLFGYPLFRKDFIMPDDDYLVVRVMFTPGSLFRLLGKPPMNLFVNQIIDADDVLANELCEVNSRISECTDYLTTIELVETYLIRKFSKLSGAMDAVDRVSYLLRNSSDVFSLDWLSDQACLSPRQFTRKFTERVGIGPKMFSRLCRFHRAYSYKEQNPQADWTSISEYCGYTDYQHLSKDFIQLAGASPPVLWSEDSRSPEKI